jgi:nitric oxide reductase large subunit
MNRFEFHDKNPSFQFGESLVLVSVEVLLSTMKNALKVYCEESSIHGFPYIVNRDLHIVEKVLWILALIASFICCGLLIYEIGVKFQEDAMVTYTSDTAISVTDVSSMMKSWLVTSST